MLADELDGQQHDASQCVPHATLKVKVGMLRLRHRKKINEHKLILGSYPEYGSQRNRADAETEVPQSAR